MYTSIIAGVLFFVSTFSLFVVPETVFNSFEDYCWSIIIRCAVSMIFMFVAVFPIFGKDQIRRYVALIALVVGISAVFTTMWTYAEMKFGFIPTLTVLATVVLSTFCWLKGRHVRLRDNG